MSSRRVITTLTLLAIALITQALRVQHTPEATALVASPTPEIPSGMVFVTKAVDGDTIELADGTRVRLIGVNTPETVDPRRPVQCFGKEASAFTHGLVDGQAVRLEKDISDTDKYGRSLRYVYLADGTFLNLELVRQGYAQVNTYPPDVAHAQEFKAAQAEARAAGRGLWSSCPVK